MYVYGLKPFEIIAIWVVLGIAIIAYLFINLPFVPLPLCPSSTVV